ncbi:MAG: hypothetical protein L0Z51_10655 [Candidatus Latescibacteria bacterium]|nr:hypothetical protein [Candidatus Latescibacterota bacterium]
MALLLAATNALAEEDRGNAFGFYGGPTTYELISSSDYNGATSGTSLDLGIYYARFVTPKFSVRVEARVTERHADIVQYIAIPASSEPYVLTRVDERFLEFPLILQADRRASMGDAEIRISSGGGLCYGILIGQELLSPDGLVNDDEGFGGYQRLSFQFDGGATVDVRSGSAIFLRFRLQYDGYVFGKSDDVPLTTEYLSYGFYAGFETVF